ncbi:hypothetical protein GGI20_003203, partial [Coemansia sp. BCRC 34301]
TVTGSLEEGTPQSLYSLGEYAELQLRLARAERRARLASALEGLGVEVSFAALMDRLGLMGRFQTHASSTSRRFDKLADAVPAVKPSKPGASLREDDFVDNFIDMVKLAEDPRRPNYVCWDHRVKPVKGSTLKPDILFAFGTRSEPTFRDAFMILEAKPPGAKNAHLACIGQLADYAMALREHQPTRMFSPVLFLDGYNVDLLIFTHRGYYKASVGQILYTSDREKMSKRRQVAKSLQRLWFLLTLPANEFGFLFDSQTIPECLRFDTRTVPATMEEASGDADGIMVIHMGKPIGRPARITGRCAYLFNAQYNGEPAILKLSWTRTDRLPEGAVYSVLEKHGVSNIPKIFASGILIENFDDYRLEFLVMEYCGTSIVDYLQSMHNPLDDSKVDPQIAQCVKDITATLTDALAAGVLHRDISADNIAIRGGAAYIVDWSCAKFLRPPTDAELMAEIERRWRFKWAKSPAAARARDPFTGTPMYMSCRLLLGAKMRGIYDDLESLFYVVLDAFSARARGKNSKDQPHGFTFPSSSTAAHIRLSCVASDTKYLESFGIRSDKSVPEAMLDAMRRFLFYEDKVHIGGKIQDGTDFPRQFDEEAASEFMDKGTIDKLLPLVDKPELRDTLAPDTAVTTSCEPSTSSAPIYTLRPPPPAPVSSNRSTRGVSNSADNISMTAGLATLKISPSRPSLTRRAPLLGLSGAQPSKSLAARPVTPSMPAAAPTARSLQQGHGSGASFAVRPVREPTNTNKAQVGPTRIAARKATSSTGAMAEGSTSTRPLRGTDPRNNSPPHTRSRSNALKADPSISSKENITYTRNTPANRGGSSAGGAGQSRNPPK